MTEGGTQVPKDRRAWGGVWKHNPCAAERNQEPSCLHHLWKRRLIGEEKKKKGLEKKFLGAGGNRNNNLRAPEEVKRKGTGGGKISSRVVEAHGGEMGCLRKGRGINIVRSCGDRRALNVKGELETLEIPLNPAVRIGPVLKGSRGSFHSWGRESGKGDPPAWGEGEGRGIFPPT